MVSERPAPTDEQAAIIAKTIFNHIDLETIIKCDIRNTEWCRTGFFDNLICLCAQVGHSKESYIQVILMGDKTYTVKYLKFNEEKVTVLETADYVPSNLLSETIYRIFKNQEDK